MALGPQFDLYRQGIDKSRHDYSVLGTKPDTDQGKYADPSDPNYTHYGRMTIVPPDVGQEAPTMNEEPGGQGIMFSQYTKPRPATVESLFVNQEAQGMVPTMLGVAQNDMYEQYGRAGDLTPSHSLSQHSSKIVKHLQQAGAVDPKYSSAVTNEVTRDDAFKQMTRMSWEPNLQKVSPEERKAGFQTAKRALRGNRAMKKPGEQFHQPELPL